MSKHPAEASAQILQHGQQGAELLKKYIKNNKLINSNFLASRFVAPRNTDANTGHEKAAVSCHYKKMTAAWFCIVF